MTAMPDWIRAAEPAPFYARGLEIAEAQRRSDEEARLQRERLQLQMEQMQREELAQQAKLNVDREYNRQMAELRKLGIQEQTKRAQMADAIRAAQMQQTGRYQQMMAATAMARELREQQASQANVKKWAEISAARQAIPMRAKELEGAGMDRDDAFRQASMEHLEAFGSAGFSSLFKSGSDPDWWIKNEVGSLRVRERELEKVLETPNLDKDLEKKFKESLDQVQSRISSLRAGNMSGGTFKVTRDANGNLVVEGMESRTALLPAVDQETGLPNPFGIAPQAGGATLPGQAGGFIPMPVQLPESPYVTPTVAGSQWYQSQRR